MEKVDYKKYSPKGDPKDTGCPESQIVIFVKNIIKLTNHIQKNKHDYTAYNKLQKELTKKRQLMKFLSRIDKERYFRMYSLLKSKKID